MPWTRVALGGSEVKEAWEPEKTKIQVSRTRVACAATQVKEAPARRRSQEGPPRRWALSVNELVDAILYPPHRSRREKNRMPFRRTAPGEINNRVPTVRSPS